VIFHIFEILPPWPWS